MKRWRWVALGVALGALFVAERRRPLRRQTEPGPDRVARNLTIGLLAAATTATSEPGPDRVARNLTIGLLAAATTATSEWPLIAPVQRLAERGRLGLLRQVPLPRALRVVLGFLLLDYTLYLWHWLNHRAPLLWRFHAVHHVDRDLDSTTGLRFHFGELTLAAGFRAAQVLLLGVDRGTLRLWQQMLFVSVVFQHSNLELPEEIDGCLAALIVTPRMHGIHHSTRPGETDSNYSSLLSCWDRLHRSLKLAVPQETITIGVAGFSAPEDVTLERSLTLPFREDLRLLPDAAI
jgi:sterol desaturase/sphingolipid hydroxylase (fatty acid hydroxylase superfamily)